MQYALVAGGSKGIGYAIAVALAKRNYNLILIGRQMDSLITAKNSLESSYKIKVTIMEKDLSLPGSAEAIAAWCQQDQLPLSMLCNVASMAGFAPIPEKNIYSATKAAVIFFSYSLRYQLKTKNISVSCLCPGPVFTKPEIMEDTIEKLGWFGKLMAVNPIKVGEVAVRKTLKNKMIIVPGVVSTLISIFLRSLPRRAITSIYFVMGQK